MDILAQETKYKWMGSIIYDDIAIPIPRDELDASTEDVIGPAISPSKFDRIERDGDIDYIIIHSEYGEIGQIRIEENVETSLLSIYARQQIDLMKVYAMSFLRALRKNLTEIYPELAQK